MMNKQDQILDLVRLKGPILPIQVARETTLSMLFASAYLAELTSSKKVLISKLKVGTSPLYYIPGQETKLQNFSKYLDNKEQEALNTLREDKILNDKALEPVIRVALRNIPDFAVPVKVNLKSGPELYWKWYLIPNNEAEIMIRELINKKNEQDNKPIESKTEQENEQQKPIPKKTEEKISEIKKEIEDKRIIETKIKPEKPKNVKKNLHKKTAPKKSTQKELIQLPKPITNNLNLNDQLLDKIKEHFNKNGIRINNCEIINENKEIDMIIQIPTIIGELTYFCKAKKKARSTESDIFTTILAAQRKGLPGLFISTGTINKKAKDILESQSKTIQFLSIK